MAVHLGKIAILVGAGVVGYILAKEDIFTSVSTLFCRYICCKLVEFLSGAVVIVFVAGYGYIWWTGWKLPEMFAMRRSLVDARDTIAIPKQLQLELEGVYSSLSITGIASQVETIHAYVALFRDEVEIIQSKVSRIEVNQASWSSSSRPAIEPANLTPPRETNGSAGGTSGVFDLLSGFGSVFTRSQSLSSAAVRAPSRESMVIYCLAILLIWLGLTVFLECIIRVLIENLSSFLSAYLG